MDFFFFHANQVYLFMKHNVHPWASADLKHPKSDYLGFLALESASWESAAGLFSVFTETMEAIQLLQETHDRPNAVAVTLSSQQEDTWNNSQVWQKCSVHGIPLTSCSFHGRAYSWHMRAYMQVSGSQASFCKQEILCQLPHRNNLVWRYDSYKD